MTCNDVSKHANLGAHWAKSYAHKPTHVSLTSLHRVDLVEVLVPHIAAVFANPLDQEGALGVTIERLHESTLPREPLVAPIGQAPSRARKSFGNDFAAPLPEVIGRTSPTSRHADKTWQGGYSMRDSDPLWVAITAEFARG